MKSARKVDVRCTAGHPPKSAPDANWILLSHAKSTKLSFITSTLRIFKKWGFFSRIYGAKALKSRFHLLHFDFTGKSVVFRELLDSNSSNACHFMNTHLGIDVMSCSVVTGSVGSDGTVLLLLEVNDSASSTQYHIVKNEGKTNKLLRYVVSNCCLIIIISMGSSIDISLYCRLNSSSLSLPLPREILFQKHFVNFKP